MLYIAYQSLYLSLKWTDLLIKKEGEHGAFEIMLDSDSQCPTSLVTGYAWAKGVKVGETGMDKYTRILKQNSPSYSTGRYVF